MFHFMFCPFVIRIHSFAKIWKLFCLPKFLEYLFYMIYVFVRNEPKVSFLFFIQLGVVLSFRIVELYIIISTNEWREKATKRKNRPFTLVRMGYICLRCFIQTKQSRKRSKGLWLLNSLVIWCKMGWCVGDVFS